jgi:hypothetical protein
MLPEIWHSVKRLLVLYHFATEDGVAENGFTKDGLARLNPALQVLYQSLPAVEIALLSVNPQKDSYLDLLEAIGDRAFDAVIIFTFPNQSPYSLAYLCYLAGIPIRLGQSNEFGGGVLSTCIKPPIDPVLPELYHLHLLKSVGFPIPECSDSGETVHSLPSTGT